MIDARTLLRNQFRVAHDVFNQVLDDIPAEMIEAPVAAEGNIAPVGAIIFHMLLGEDYFVQSMAKGGTPLSAEFLPRIGMPFPEGGTLQASTAPHVAQHLPEFRQYAKDVFAATDAALASMSEEDLSREIDGFTGRTTVVNFLGEIGLNHLIGHTSEIAALKGVRGLKGLPF